MMKLAGKTVVVVGLGESGVAAARLALDQGADVVALDSAPEEKLSQAARDLGAKGARVIAGRHDDGIVKRADLVVVSPGVPPMAIFDQAYKSGSLVIGEIEF